MKTTLPPYVKVFCPDCKIVVAETSKEIVVGTQMEVHQFQPMNGTVIIHGGKIECPQCHAAWFRDGQILTEMGLFP